MPSFYFRLRTPDQTAHRVERHNLPNLDAALVAAQRVARGLVRNPVRRGHMTIGGSLDIENDGQRALARLVLAEIAHQVS